MTKTETKCKDTVYVVTGRSILTGARNKLTVPCSREKAEAVRRKYTRKGGSWCNLKVEPYMPDLFESCK